MNQMRNKQVRHLIHIVLLYFTVYFRSCHVEQNR